MCKAIDYTEQIINVLSNTALEKKQLDYMMHECDLKTQDLLHEIELNDIKGMYHAWLILKELKGIRKVRRKAKDELMILESTESFRNAQMKKCKNLVNTISKKEESLKNRHYHKKTNLEYTLRTVSNKEKLLNNLKIKEAKKDISINM